jgi:hypothetical protein
MRSRRGLIGVLAVVLLLGAAWWALQAPAPPPVSPRGGPVSPREAGAGVAEAEAPVEAPPEVADGGLWLTATLEGAAPFTGEGRVGPAFVAEGDEGWWEEERRRGSSSVGPSSLSELANVREWLTASVTASTKGGVLGPVAVPPASRYQVVAFTPDGTFWSGDFVPGTKPVSGLLDAGVLRANRPTGVSVRLDGARDVEGTFSVRMERIVDRADAERASALMPVLALVDPDLGRALVNGTPVPVSPDADTRLAPLPPDPAVRLVLRAPSGREGTGVEVPLREGTVTPVTLDVARLFPEGVSRSLTLRGRVLLEGTSRPGGQVVYGPTGAETPVDAEGRFTIPDVPAWHASRFSVARDEVERGRRPEAPSPWHVTFTPTDAMRGAVDVEWRVPRFRWLVLRMDAFTRAQLAERSQPPYPVYALERRDARGAWSEVPTESFVDEADGVAVSVLEPGTYRVQVASSPYAVRASSVARVGGEGGDAEARLSPDAASGSGCEVHVTRAGRPVSGASVRVGGASRSLPPMRAETDVMGRWRMGAVNSSAVPMQVQAGDAEAWEGDAAEACRTSGVVEVAL